MQIIQSQHGVVKKERKSSQTRQMTHTVRRKREVKESKTGEMHNLLQVSKGGPDRARDRIITSPARSLASPSAFAD